MDINERTKLMRENGKSHDYIMGYLDGIFDTLKEQREEIVKDIKKNLNEYKAKVILGD